MNHLQVSTVPPRRPIPPTMTRGAAAAALDLSRNGVDKLVVSGLLPDPIPRDAVAALANRSVLQVDRGEITVIRQGMLAPADPFEGDPRTRTGFHTTMTDDELDAASLRWWRCDPQRVVANGLLVVVVATIPVAVYRVGVGSDIDYLLEPESGRAAFTGRLLARWGDTPEQIVARCRPIPSSPMTAAQQPLAAVAATIMGARVHTESGGPVAYLTATEPTR